VTFAGSERVLEQMLACFPHADLFSLIDFFPGEHRHRILNKVVKTSVLQNFPLAKKNYRNYLPILPLIVEQFDLSNYDVVISSSHAVAKGVLTSPNQLHICMCYSPIRYAWDLQFQYLSESNLQYGLKSWIARWILHKIRIWDARSANSVDHFIAISEFIGKRIQKVYRRESSVIYPPVDLSSFSLFPKKENFYLTASRMVPYKKISMIIDAFSAMPDKHLVVIGEGPEFAKCKMLAKSNVTLMGWQPFDVLKDYMQRARAFVFAAEEDFGITPLEAQACGTPVIGFGGGALLETIRGINDPKPTGVFFARQDPEEVKVAVKLFEREIHRFKPENCRDNVLRFSQERFRSEFADYVALKWNQFSNRSSLVA